MFRLTLIGWSDIGGNRAAWQESGGPAAGSVTGNSHWPTGLPAVRPRILGPGPGPRAHRPRPLATRPVATSGTRPAARRASGQGIGHLGSGAERLARQEAIGAICRKHARQAESSRGLPANACAVLATGAACYSRARGRPDDPRRGDESTISGAARRRRTTS